jgi:hypothetical protein
MTQVTLFETMERSACFSACGTYRYILTRRWDKYKKTVNFVMLNPSKADHEIDDPTIRRCINFAKAWGYGQIVVTNQFGFKGSNPYDMRRGDDPIGPDNDHFLAMESAVADLRIAAWGVHGDFLGRDKVVFDIISHGGTLPVHWIGRCKTKNGQPGHPLYIPKTAIPELWSLSK